MKKALIISSAGQAVKMGLQVVQTILLARLVAPADFGSYAILAPLYAILSSILEGGLTMAAVTNDHLTDRLKSNLLWIQLTIGTLGIGVMFVGALISRVLFRTPDLTFLGVSLGCSFFLTTIGLQSRALLRRKSSVGILSAVDIFSVTAGLVVIWLASSYWRDGRLIALSMATIGLVSSIMYWYYAPISLARFVWDSDTKKATKLGVTMALSDALNVLRTQLPIYLIGSRLTLADVGLFNRANTLIQIPLTVVNPAVTNVILPAIARDKYDKEKVRKHLITNLNFFLYALIPASTWVAFGPLEVVRLTLGPNWISLTPLLAALSPLVATQLIAKSILTGLTGMEKAKDIQSFAVWNLIITVGAVWAASYFGLIAICLALSASLLILRMPLLFKYAFEAGCMVRSDIWQIVRTILIAAGPVSLVIIALRFSPVRPLAAEIVSLVVALLTSGVLLLKTFPKRK